MATGTGTTVSTQATEAMLGANPFIGLSRAQLAAATGRFLGHAARHAPVVAGEGRRLAGQLADVVRGSAEIAPDPKDRRFGDDMYRDNPLYRRLAQAYLASCASATTLVSKVELDRKSEQRAKFALSLVTEALAPTNQLAGNPAAMRKAVETKGRSLLDGTRHFVDDLRHNGGMPSMVDREPFQPGATIAVTPGAVVYRDEVLELIQYRPSTKTVRARPLVVIPPQINKFYVMDLAPARSMVEHLLAQGHQLFMVSWRNPTADQRDWNLDTYVERAAHRDRRRPGDHQVAGRQPRRGLLGRDHLGGAARPPRRGRGRSGGVGDAARHRAGHGHRIVGHVVPVGAVRRRGDPPLAAKGRAARRRPRPDVRVATTQRPRVELLGQQLPARQPPTSVRRAGVERRLDQPPGGPARRLPDDRSRQRPGDIRAGSRCSVTQST